MKKLTWLVIVALCMVCPTSAEDDVQWVRVTVLLETGPKTTHRAEESLVPGGAYSIAEVERRGLAAIDKEILERVRFLGESMSEAEQSMRLATLLARQYYLPLEVGTKVTVPTIDLNPRLSMVLEPLRFSGDRVVCKVQFLEPEGPPGSTDFTGEPISLTLQEADLRDVIETFSVLTQREIVVDEGVAGEVTIDLRKVPWDQALDLVLRTNDLGLIREGDTLRVAPLVDLNLRKRVRTEATVSLPRGAWGSATIASRGDAANPTVVLVIESVGGRPESVAEKLGLARPKMVLLVPPTSEDIANAGGELAVIRGQVTEVGRLQDAEVLAAPSPAFAERLLGALPSWRFRAILDKEGRRQEAIVGYGVRLRPPRVLASIGAVEHVGVEISGRPIPDHADRYLVEVVVSDLDTGEPITAPHIVMAKGGEASMRTSFVAPSGKPSKIEIRVLVGEDGKSLSYSWSVTSDGKVVSSHKAEFEL